MKIAKKAPDALKLLWRDKFFQKEKSLKETEVELHKQGYNFGDAMRKALESAKFLLLQGKQGDRKFIQKHPYTEEEENEKKRNK